LGILSEMSALTNPRSTITVNKNQKQIDWRRNKVRQFLIRGYSQYEIANTLRVSQPTVSRDINYFRRQTYFKHNQDFGIELFDSHKRTIFGINELLMKTWEIVDNPKTDTKQKIKAISLAQQLHNKLFEYQKMGYEITQLKEYAQNIMKNAQEIEKREKALQAFVKGDASARNKILEEIKSRQQTKKLSETTPEERYQLLKKNWMSHESSWFRRGLNRYDEQGCNQFTGCISECRYYPEYGMIEDEEWLRLIEPPRKT
jgi:hypothetical protein